MEIRQNPTNAGNESKGFSLGLEGDQFLILLAGVVIGVGLFIVAVTFLNWAIGASVAAALAPVALAMAYLYCFYMGKPPAYRLDWLKQQFGQTTIRRADTRPNPYSGLRAGDNRQHPNAGE